MPAVSPIPSDSPIVSVTRDQQTGKEKLSKFMSDDFSSWLLELTTRFNNTPESIGNGVALEGQSASIAATPAYTTQSAGYYRVSVYARVTTADGVSSSLIVTIAWTDGGIAVSKASAAITGNTTASEIDPFVFLIRADQATAINYATTYVSNTPGTMVYRLTVVVETVPV